MNVSGWRKAKDSSDTNCVEVNLGLKKTVGIRDSKDPEHKELHLSKSGWEVFLKAAQGHHFSS